MLPQEIKDFRRSKARPPSLIIRPSAKIPKRRNSAIAGGVGATNYGR
jgi:hypothetical protein